MLFHLSLVSTKVRFQCLLRLNIELVICTVLAICSCSSLLFPCFSISRIRVTSSGVNWIPCLFALVIKASMTGARSFPVLPEVFDAAIRISSSLAGSIFFIAGLFIHSSAVIYIISFLRAAFSLGKHIAVYVEHLLLFRG